MTYVTPTGVSTELHACENIFGAPRKSRVRIGLFLQSVVLTQKRGDCALQTVHDIIMCLKYLYIIFAARTRHSYAETCSSAS